MQKISINNVLKGIVDIGFHGKGDELAQSLMNVRGKNVIVRNTFLKLLNDESFYEQSVESGLLQEYSKWLKDTFSIKSKKTTKPKVRKPRSSFLSRSRVWTDEQLIAFITVAFSSDIYSRELKLDEDSSKKTSLDNLIMQSMGLNQPRSGINKLNISSLKKGGLKRFVTELNGDNAQVVLISLREMVQRGTELAEIISRKFSHDTTNSQEVMINYGAIKKDIGIDQAGYKLQLQPYHKTWDSIHVLTGMIHAAIDPVAPNDVFKREYKSSDELLDQILEQTKRAKELCDYLTSASSVVVLGTNSRLITVMDELSNVVATLKRLEKLSSGQKNKN